MENQRNSQDTSKRRFAYKSAILFSALVAIGLCVALAYTQINSLPALERASFDRDWSKIPDKTLEAAQQLILEANKQELDRFRHIDTKAINYMGLVGVAITLLLGFTGVLLNHSATQKNDPSVAGPELNLSVLILVTFAFAFLVFTFFAAYSASKIPPSSASFFLDVLDKPLKLSSPEGLDEDVILNKELLERRGAQGVKHYKYIQLVHLRDMLEANRYANNVKATWMRLSQNFAIFSVILLFLAAISFLIGAVGQQRRAHDGEEGDPANNALLHNNRQRKPKAEQPGSDFSDNKL